MKRLKRLCALSAAGFSMGISLQAHSAGSFTVDVVGKAGEAVTLSCERVVGESNAYRTKTRSYARAERWNCEDAHACSTNTWTLSHTRVSETESERGRCVTPFSEDIAGDGVFSAKIYIEPAVEKSDGVFTIAIMPMKFSKKEELDLVVINVENNLVKFGNPGKAASIAMSRIDGQWINVIMNRHGNRCALRIEREKKGTIDLGKIGCNIAAGNNRIVINSRSRDGGSYVDASVKIAQVKWQAR